jgi:hypothetical protein
MMEAIFSSDTSVLTRATRHYIPEGGILHSQRRENLKSYIVTDQVTDCFLVKIPDNGQSTETQ